MNNDQTPGQTQRQRQQQGRQNAQPDPQRADQAPDLAPLDPAAPGGGGGTPDRGDHNRTPWQGQRPAGQPPDQQQGDIPSRHQQQQGTSGEDTYDAGDTRPLTDDRHSSGAG